MTVIDKRIVNRQQGSALILTVMMIMALGLLGLNTVNQHLNAALSLTRSEKQYLQSWELAVSSLNWGLQRHWTIPNENQWLCVGRVNSRSTSEKFEQTSDLKSCLKKAEVEGQYFLRGEGRVLPEAPPVFLYQLTTLVTPDGSETRLKPQLNGWLDFCPLKDEVNCNES